MWLLDFWTKRKEAGIAEPGEISEKETAYGVTEPCRVIHTGTPSVISEVLLGKKDVGGNPE